MKTAFSLKREVLPSQKKNGRTRKHLGRPFPGDTRWLREGTETLRLLNTLETIITKRLGCNVEVQSKTIAQLQSKHNQLECDQD